MRMQMSAVFTVAGTVDDFNATRFHKGLASLFGNLVDEREIILDVASASVQVRALLTVKNLTISILVSQKIMTASKDGSLSTIVGADVQQVADISQQWEVYIPQPFAANYMASHPDGLIDLLGDIGTNAMAVGMTLAAIVGGGMCIIPLAFALQRLLLMTELTAFLAHPVLLEVSSRVQWVMSPTNVFFELPTTGIMAQLEEFTWTLLQKIEKGNSTGDWGSGDWGSGDWGNGSAPIKRRLTQVENAYEGTRIYTRISDFVALLSVVLGVHFGFLGIWAALMVLRVQKKRVDKLLEPHKEMIKRRMIKVANCFLKPTLKLARACVKLFKLVRPVIVFFIRPALNFALCIVKCFLPKRCLPKQGDQIMPPRRKPRSPPRSPPMSPLPPSPPPSPPRFVRSVTRRLPSRPRLPSRVLRTGRFGSRFRRENALIPVWARDLCSRTSGCCRMCVVILITYCRRGCCTALHCGATLGSGSEHGDFVTKREMRERLKLSERKSIFSLSLPDVLAWPNPEVLLIIFCGAGVMHASVQGVIAQEALNFSIGGISVLGAFLLWEWYRVIRFQQQHGYDMFNEAIPAETVLEVDDPLLRLLARLGLLHPRDRFHGVFEAPAADLKEPARTLRLLKGPFSSCVRNPRPGDKCAALSVTWLASVGQGNGIFYQVARFTVQIAFAAIAAIPLPYNPSSHAALVQAGSLASLQIGFGAYSMTSAAGDRVEGIFAGAECLLSGIAVSLQYAATHVHSFTLLNMSGYVACAAFIMPFIVVVHDTVILHALALIYSATGKKKFVGAVQRASSSVEKRLPPKLTRGLSNLNDHRKSLTTSLNDHRKSLTTRLESKLESPNVSSSTLVAPASPTLKPSMPPARKKSGKSISPTVSFMRQGSRGGRMSPLPTRSASPPLGGALMGSFDQVDDTVDHRDLKSQARYKKIKKQITCSNLVASATVEFQTYHEHAALQAQASWRGWSTRKFVNQMKAETLAEKDANRKDVQAALVIQVFARGYLARRPEILELARINRSVRKLQIAWMIKTGRMPAWANGSPSSKDLVGGVDEDDVEEVADNLEEDVVTQLVATIGAEIEFQWQSTALRAKMAADELADQLTTEMVARTAAEVAQEVMRTVEGPKKNLLASTRVKAAHLFEPLRASSSPVVAAPEAAPVVRKARRNNDNHNDAYVPLFKPYQPRAKAQLSSREAWGEDDSGDGSDNEDVFFAHFGDHVDNEDSARSGSQSGLSSGRQSPHATTRRNALRRSGSPLRP